MRVVERLGRTYILPFGPDEGEPPYIEYILIQPNGMIRLIGFCGAGMNPISTRQLGEALLHAAEMAQNGPK